MCFCFYFLLKTFLLIGSFCSQKVTYEHSINVARHLNVKSMKFDSVYSTYRIWNSLKFLFLHIFTRMFYIKKSLQKNLYKIFAEKDYKKVIFICFNEKPLKSDEKFFLFHSKSSFTLREKCQNAQFFLVRIFLYSYWIQENTDQKKAPYLDTFHAVSDAVVRLQHTLYMVPFFILVYSNKSFYCFSITLLITDSFSCSY